MSTALQYRQFTFEQSLEGWTLLSGQYPYNTDYGYGIGRYVVLNQSIAREDLAKYDLSQLNFTPKYLVLMVKTNLPKAGDIYVYVKLLDENNNLITSVSDINPIYIDILVLKIPSNTRYIVLSWYANGTYASGYEYWAWFDNIVLLSDGSIIYHANGVFFSDAQRTLTISINLSGNFGISFTNDGASIFSTTTFTEQLSATDTSNNPTTISPTIRMTNVNSIGNYNLTIQVSSSVSQAFSYTERYIPIYDRTSGKFLNFIIIKLNLNGMPLNPDVLTAIIPAGYTNYNVTITGSLKIQHTSSSNVNVTIQPQTTFSGASSDIQTINGTIEIKVLDANNNVVYDQTITITNGSIASDFPSFTINAGTYTINVIGTITNNVSADTYIYINFNYTLTPIL